MSKPPHPSSLREAVAHLTRHPKVMIRSRSGSQYRSFNGLKDGRLRFGDSWYQLGTCNGREVGLEFTAQGLLWTSGDDVVAVHYQTTYFLPRDKP